MTSKKWKKTVRDFLRRRKDERKNRKYDVSPKMVPKDERKKAYMEEERREREEV